MPPINAREIRLTDTTDQRFAPPEAHVADMPSGEMELAGRGLRLLAVIVDALIAWCAIMLAGLLPGVGSLIKPATADMSLTSLNFSSLAVGYGVFLLIQGWPLVTRGQTIAKMLFKIRIVRTDGSKAGALHVLGLRYGIGYVLNLNPVVSAIWGLIDSLAIFRDSHQCLHDSIAGTKVIKL